MGDAGQVIPRHEGSACEGLLLADCEQNCVIGDGEWMGDTNAIAAWGQIPDTSE